MLAPGKLYVNTTLRLTTAFRDQNGVLVDPVTVRFKTRSPCCTERTYVYLTNAEVSKISTGRYAAEIQPDETGRWHFRWETVTPTFATEGDFLIQDSRFSPWSNSFCNDYCWW